MFTKQENEFLIKGLMKSFNKQEAKMSAIQDELREDGAELLEGFLLLAEEIKCQNKMKFILGIVEKIEQLTLKTN